MLEDILKMWDGVEVTPMDVYRDIFKLGEGYIQKDGEQPGKFKANPIGYWKNEKDETGHFRIMFEDTFEETLKELQKADFSLLNGITYFGRKRDQNHASKMYAMIFDLDGVNDTKLNAFLNAANKLDDMYPLPNYIVLSGHGIHLYYVFEEPISLFPNTKIQLKTLKKGLTERIWNPYTSDYDERGLKIEQQGIFQPFRAIGGKTKKDAPEKRLRAFRMNQHPFSISVLNRFVPEEFRMDEGKIFKESKITLEQAKEKYPEWYKKVIDQKDDMPNKWDIAGKVHGENPYALYDWWKKKTLGATYKHRYFTIMCLVIYGVKCDVPYDIVKQDALDAIPRMNEIYPEEPFTESDVLSALECYDQRYCTFPLDDIETLSAIPVPRNKRNGRKQAVHLERARAVQKIDYPNDEWRNTYGAPTAQNKVLAWRKMHPEGRKEDCHRDTGMSRDTIRKWWDTQKPKNYRLEDGHIVVDVTPSQGLLNLFDEIEENKQNNN